MQHLYYQHKNTIANNYNLNKISYLTELLSNDDIHSFLYFKNMFKNKNIILKFKVENFDKKMKSNFHIYQKLEPFIIKTINNLFKKMKKISNRIENLYKINLFGFLGLIIYKIYQAPFTKLNNNSISETNLKLLGIEKFLKNNILTRKMDFTLKNSNWLKRNDYKFCISKYETLSIYKDKNYRNILYYVKQKINQNINADIKFRIYYLLNIYTLLFYNLNLTKKGDVLCTLK